MAFFDFHCHPFTKPVWMKGVPQTLLAEGIVETRIDRTLNRDIGTVLLSVFGKNQIRFFDSQSSLGQIQRGGGHIIVASLVAMENAYANLDFCIFKKVLRRIKDVQLEQLTKLGDSELDYEFVTMLERNIAVQFAGQVLQDATGLKYRLVNSFNEIRDDGVLNIILSVEGGHCFYSDKAIQTQEELGNITKVVDRLHAWKEGTKNGTQPRLLYVTITHHTTNGLTNHAFAVPPGLAGKGTNEKAGGFNPTGDGLTEAGRSFIQKALSETNGQKRVLIDVKHMSLKARRQFYTLRREMIARGERPFPIVATHMGVTGLSWNDAVVQTCFEFPDDPKCYEVEYRNTERVGGFSIPLDENRRYTLKFYPWSINLYDEEIREIVQSGGLIGFSFDSRILGNETIDRERFSKKEIGALPSMLAIDFNQTDQQENGEITYAFSNVRPFESSSYPEDLILDSPFSSPDKLKKNTDLMALCQNIIHAVRVGGPQTWDCICIGSDYDGLINAIDFVPDAAGIPAMRESFVNYLGLMVRKLNEHIREQRTGENPLTLPTNVFDKFTLLNAQRFLQQHFS